MSELFRHLGGAKISEKDMARLLPLVTPNSTTPDPEQVSNLFACLHAAKLNSRSQDYTFTVYVKKALQWCVQARDSPVVQAGVKKFFSSKENQTGVFLFKTYLAAELLSIQGSEPFGDCVVDLSSAFVPPSESILLESKRFGEEITVRRDLRFVQKLLKTYEWTVLEKPLSACLVIYVSLPTKAAPFNLFPEVASVLTLLDSKGITYDGLFEAFVGQFCIELQHPKFRADRSDSQKRFRTAVPMDRSKVSALLSPGDINCAKIFFRFASEDHFHRMASWYQSQSDIVVELLLDLVDRVHECIAKPAATSFVNNLHRYHYDSLLSQTETGRPTLSWSMPNASFPQNPDIQAFLRGPEMGPREFIVGGGITNARRLSNKHPGRTVNKDGYSALIVAGQGKGAKASVVVRKTDDLFKSQVAQYERIMAKIGSIRKKLTKQGVFVEHQET